MTELEKLERAYKGEHIQPPNWWLDELSEDAKFLVTLLCSGKVDSLLYNRKGKLKRRKRIVKSVFRFLKYFGWESVRIHRCFKNIEQSLE